MRVKTPRILLIDNSILASERIAQGLLMNLDDGALVERCLSALDASQKIQLFRPNVVVMNFTIALYTIDGNPFLPLLIKRWHMPIITYGLLPSCADSARSLGATTYIEKPEDSSEGDFLKKLAGEVVKAVERGKKQVGFQNGVIPSVQPGTMLTRASWEKERPASKRSLALKKIDEMRENLAATSAMLRKGSRPPAKKKRPAEKAWPLSNTQRHTPEHATAEGRSAMVARAKKNVELIKPVGLIFNRNFDPDLPTPAIPPEPRKGTPMAPHSMVPPDLIAIGSSTGGPQALTKIFTKIPHPMPPILIVQHIPANFSGLFAKRLDSECDLHIKEAEDGDEPEENTVYIAPGGQHMTLERRSGRLTIRCGRGKPVHNCCPSADVLFHSVAGVLGKAASGVILTGMGRDGADGLFEMRTRGSRTIGQDEASSVVYGMPRAAYEVGAVEHQYALGDMADAIIRLAHGPFSD